MYFNSVIGSEKNIVYELNKELKIISSSSEKILQLEKSIYEGYKLICDMDGVRLQYKSSADLGRALLSLSSIEILSSDIITKGRSIDDFGVMFDVSRNAVLKVETVKQLMRISLLLGYCFVGLYMEDTLEIPGEPFWGYQRGAYSKEEINELVSYSKILNVELRPFIQTLAHINQVIRYDRYGQIVDADDVLLIGDDRTNHLIDKAIDNISNLFDSPVINIGMDEAYLVGRGKYLDINGYKPRKEIMSSHLEHIIKACERNNRKVQMWSDMFFGFAIPENVNESNAEGIVPNQVQICYWDYYSQNANHYEDRLKAHKKLTEDLGFACGAWKWSGLIPHNKFSIKANKVAIEACKKYDVKSITVTCWGDNGAEASCFSVLPTLYEAANSIYEDGIDDIAFLKLTGLTLDTFLKLDDVNPYMETGKNHNNCSKYLLYNDPLFGTFDSIVPTDITEKFEAELVYVKKCLQNKNKFEYIFVTAQKLLEVLLIKATLGIKIRKAYKEQDTKKLDYIAHEIIPDLLVKIEDLYKEFMKQWYRENKSFGFEVQTIRFGGLTRRLQDVMVYLEDFINNGTVIEELEQNQLPYGYTDETDISGLNYNLWSNIVSPNVIG